jgi:hypothetical protein
MSYAEITKYIVVEKANRCIARITAMREQMKADCFADYAKIRKSTGFLDLGPKRGLTPQEMDRAYVTAFEFYGSDQARVKRYGSRSMQIAENLLRIAESDPSLETIFVSTSDWSSI